MVNFTAGEDFERWLISKPNEWANALASRTALRVAPLLLDAFDNEIDQVKARHEIILPVWRCLAASWVAAKYPTFRTNFSLSAKFALDAATVALKEDALGAANVALAAINAVYVPIQIYNSDVMSSGVEPAIHGAVESAASAVSSAVDATRAVKDDAERLWAAISSDATLLESGIEPANLGGHKLWNGRKQTQFLRSWRRLKALLLQVDNENWAVWTEWYDARLNGLAANGTLELARVMVRQEDWSQGPRVANAEIKRLIDEHTPNTSSEKIPEVPTQGPGPRYRANEDGLVDRARSTDIDESGNDAGTIRNLLPLAQRCADDLKARLSPNQFPELLTTADHYLAALKAQPGSNIEWGEVWGLGVMLQNAATASERKIDGRLVDALEDSAKAALDSLLTIHGPLILATRDGAQLSEVAAGFAMTREQQEALRDAAERVAEDLKKRKDIITPHAADSVVQAVHEIGQGPHPERGSVFALATVKNISIVLIGGAAVATPALIGAMLGATMVGALVGAPLSLLVVEAVKKSPAFNALVTQLGAKLDTMTDVELRAWLDERARRYAPFRSFVIDNQEHLRKIAEATPELKWMLRYIDFIAANSDKK